MSNYSHNELPIRVKTEMAESVGKIIAHLHNGQKKEADLLIQDLKARSVYLDEAIQQAVLIFAEEVSFQYAYDPWHKVTNPVQKAADGLIEELGLNPPGPQINVL